MRKPTYSKFSSARVISDMGDMHRILRRRDGRFARRANKIVHEAGEAALLLQLIALARLIAVALPRAPGGGHAIARLYVLHPPASCCYQLREP